MSNLLDGKATYNSFDSISFLTIRIFFNVALSELQFYLILYYVGFELKSNCFEKSLRMCKLFCWCLAE